MVPGSPNEIVSGTPPVQLPKTNEEVKWRQMDIIYFLANHGVPVTEKDSTGHTPFDKATLLDEINFMEGAVLLGRCHCCCCVVHTYYLLNDCVMFAQMFCPRFNKGVSLKEVRWMEQA